MARPTCAVLVDRHRGRSHERRDLGARPCFANIPSMPAQSSSRPTSRRAGPPARCSASSAAARRSRPLPKSTSRPSPSSNGRVGCSAADRVQRARVLGLDQDQAGLHARDVEGVDARPGRCRSRAPASNSASHTASAPSAGIQLVAAVARVAGPRDVDRHAADLRAPVPEVLHVGPVLAGRGLEHLAAELALQRERRRRLGDVLDLDVEAGRVQHEPAVAGVRGGDPVLRLAQTA